ncbi:helix-turn-helix domain-containing protein [uncultured Deinococcus sp.]|uniref:helix-turn-helix domain-containing protein n=1 Tax=uncultured Deinococcus sp. TaxID=158789 RepID=UPI0025831459|nr:helix-turn-helix domain-containing protein [uncultured Deinococcus sp.]
MSTPAFYSINSAAEYINVHPKTVRKLIRNGELKAVRPLGSIYRIPHSELQRWINEQLEQVKK